MPSDAPVAQTNNHQQQEAGLAPKYSKMPTYGKPPAYLAQRKAEEERYQQQYEAYMRAQHSGNAGSYTQLTEDQRFVCGWGRGKSLAGCSTVFVRCANVLCHRRQQLLQGLKANWDRLHHEFQVSADSRSLGGDIPSRCYFLMRVELARVFLCTFLLLILMHPPAAPQGLSVVTDTVAKRNRRNRLEAQLNEIEADINLLEKHSHILIEA